jgi:GxxExxY protein
MILTPEKGLKQNLIYKDECYAIVGACMEVHKTLGRGFSENVYKDALEFEFDKRLVPFEREKGYTVNYKEKILPHKFYADFVVYDKIILEVKACKDIADEFLKQTLNYMAIAKSKLGIIVSFGGQSLKYKRLVL